MLSQCTDRFSYKRTITIDGKSVTFDIERLCQRLIEEGIKLEHKHYTTIRFHTTIFNKNLTDYFNIDDLSELSNKAIDGRLKSWYIETRNRISEDFYHQFIKKLNIKPSRYDLSLGRIWYDEWNIRFSINSGILFRGNKVLGEAKEGIDPLSMIKELEKLIKQETMKTWKSELNYKIGIEKYEIN